MADLKTTFGAKGDGVTDDTAAFELAISTIARKGTILLPKGTYVITRVSACVWYEAHAPGARGSVVSGGLFWQSGLCSPESC